MRIYINLFKIFWNKKADMSISMIVGVLAAALVLVLLIMYITQQSGKYDQFLDVIE